MNKKLVLAVGELLWDLLPQGPRLGGAAANYSVMAARLGNHAALLSRVGRDDLGRKALSLLESLPVDVSHIQIDPQHATGTVTVELQHGQPSYVIYQPVAWDYLEDTGEWQQLAARASAIWYGTLTQRTPVARDTVQSLLAASFPECIRLFDVNLREPFFSAEILEESMEFATVLKLNDEEVPKVMELLGLSELEDVTTESLLAGARVLLGEFPLQLVAITRGGKGSILVTRNAEDVHPGVPATVADTIGSGDAFAAALTSYLLQDAPISVLNEAGNRWGSWVASQSGAIPELSDAVLHRITQEIGEDER